MDHARLHHRGERNGHDHVRAIEPELLYQYLRSKRPALVLDVRNGAEFHHRHIHGAISIPLSELLGRLNELSDHKHALLVVVSKSGVTARLAGLELEFAGFTEVRCLEGGLAGWVKRGLSTERSYGLVEARVGTEPIPPSVELRRP